MGLTGWMDRTFTLASCSYYFIIMQENLLQNPSNKADEKGSRQGPGIVVFKTSKMYCCIEANTKII